MRSGFSVSSSSSASSVIVSIVFRFEGVSAAAPRISAVLFADGVAILPPDSESRSNKPSVFPSRCGVGPIAAFRGVRCVLGLKSRRKAVGESYGSSWEGWEPVIRLVDGVAKVCLAVLRGVGAGSAFSGPVEEACFRFFESLSGFAVSVELF